MGFLSRKTDLSKRWEVACYMQRNFLQIFGLRNLKIPITLIKHPFIDMLRT
jgi:hypothetical protein